MQVISVQNRHLPPLDLNEAVNLKKIAVICKTPLITRGTSVFK